MKHLIIVIVAASLALPSLADDAHHPEKAQQQTLPTPAAKPQQSGQTVDVAQERMKKMQDIMAKLAKTSDPAERQKLLREHMQAMSEGMQMMKDMGAGMMNMERGGMMMGMDGQNGAKGKSKQAQQACPMMEHGMMSKHMEMMQMMMEQMLEHQKASEAP